MGRYMVTVLKVNDVMLKQLQLDSPGPVWSRMLKTGSSAAALLMSSRICSTLGGSGRLGRTTRFLLLDPMFILQLDTERP